MIDRNQLAALIWKFIPVEALVPEDAARWRPVVRDAIDFVFRHISQPRLETKVQEQMALPWDTPPEERLLKLISRVPGLQKVGQVIARNRRISPKLREQLAKLENGMHDVTAPAVRSVIEERLGQRLTQYQVELAGEILSEASVSAVMRFTWRKAEREREEGVFKVLKPHIPDCFAEDMKLLRDLGGHIAKKHRKYGFAVGPVRETLDEVRLLLEHELEFDRERRTLEDARRMYRSSFGIRVPRVIPELSAEGITAMSAENGVKVTDAFRHWPVRRERIAQQIVEAVIAVPFFSWTETPVFHADPHAGNMLYDEPNRELVLLDWALAERLDRESRRQLVLLALMTMFRNADGVCNAIEALSRKDGNPERVQVIRAHVDGLFTKTRGRKGPGVLDAMMLLEKIALEGVRFPGALFLFRKVLFTLEGVLHDVTGHPVEIDGVIVREFLARAIASVGLFHAPLQSRDFVTIQREALRYPWRRLARS